MQSPAGLTVTVRAEYSPSTPSVAFSDAILDLVFAAPMEILLEFLLLSTLRILLYFEFWIKILLI